MSDIGLISEAHVRTCSHPPSQRTTPRLHPDPAPDDRTPPTPPPPTCPKGPIQPAANTPATHPRASQPPSARPPSPVRPPIPPPNEPHCSPNALFTPPPDNGFHPERGTMYC